MPSRRHLTIIREFRTLKANRHIIGDDQYVKELKRLLADIKADIASPDLSPMELKLLQRLMRDNDAT
ncbi:hypothetical protein L0P88_04190 [Muricauda sp. SCSIO 64092]|uniref:hypothetical protein n=1 Tax=Allomuricauda sp. SCSIO 64092 TaxID=2908842 RepID=UPI001FF55378|nr:hypothetical protein [Muricauda sp. SCSIO 64092]UOY07755.1 hypothetical protein L0P88_04190 [Muricauda sp. SCSIO 64092]